MRIFPESMYRQLPSDSSQRFLIQVWYSMLHQNSLDSYRVPCMNPINIVRELRTLMSKTEVLPVHWDIIMCVKETSIILERDHVVKKHFTLHYTRLQPLLASIAKIPQKDAKTVSSYLSPIIYYLKDFAAELENNYLALAVKELELLINQPNMKPEIRRLLGNLLSTTLDTGHSIEAVFSIAMNVLPAKSAKDARNQPPTFDKRLKSATHILQSPKENYEVVFRLDNFSRFEPELTEIKPISFSRTWQWKQLPVAHEKFAGAVGPVVYAGVTVDAHDQHAAVQSAKNTLGSVLDIIRFEFEPQPIRLNDQAMVRKSEPRNEEFKPVHTGTVVPNPRSNVTHAQLAQFTQQLNAILQRNNIEPSSHKRIEAAFRYYRTGCDSLHFENKFLNWWMALEFLLSSGNGQSIIDRVQKPLCSILVQTYARKHLASFLGALRYCKVQDVDGMYSVADFYRLIIDQARFDRLVAALDNYPILQTGLEWLHVNIVGAANIKDFYIRHQRKLNWHIQRIYRMRCDIVHSAGYDLGLSLLSANLEYYLKSMLEYMLTVFASNPMLNSIDEILVRAEALTKQILNDLGNGKTDIFEQTLTDTPI